MSNINTNKKVTTTNEIKKSPFMLSLIGGSLAITADIAWIVSELLKDLHITTEFVHLVVRFGISITLVIALIFCVLAAINYLNNGYARADTKVVLESKKERIQQRKRNNIFMNQ